MELLALWTGIPMILSYLALYAYFAFAQRKSIKQANYRGKEVVLGIGIVIPLVFCVLSIISTWMGIQSPLMELMYLHAFMLVGLGTIGYLDDLIGNRSIKGFRGHFGALLKERTITTGFLKAFVAFLIGLLLNLIIQDDWYRIALGTIDFALWTNLFNLLDVRPTRAIKGFWIAFGVLVWFISEIIFPMALIIIGITLVLYDADRKEKGMLGDAGANALGGIIGFWIILTHHVGIMFIFLIIGIWITLYAERKSIHQWIEIHPVIRLIDGWGRKT